MEDKYYFTSLYEGEKDIDIQSEMDKNKTLKEIKKIIDRYYTIAYSDRWEERNFDNGTQYRADVGGNVINKIRNLLVKN